MRVAPALEMTIEQRAELMARAKSSTAPHREVARARLLLDAADGMANVDLAGLYQVSVLTVAHWRRRFSERGMADFAKVDKGRGPKASISQDVVEKIAAAASSKPDGKTQYSSYDAAKQFGVSASSVQRIWRGRGLKPHRAASFKVSNDPDFEAKLVDVVGLYMDPPDNAVVISVDEKSQIQALDRTQPGLPIKKGRAGTFTHDYKRNGTTTLFAGLDVLTGKVIGTCQPRHRHQEYLKFLRLIDKSVDAELDIHVVADNYATHKHADVKAWLEAHPRFHMHYTPTSSSWLNLVERWFRDLTGQALKRGVFASVPDLIAAIDAYIDANNADPKPFIWTATADKIITKVKRARTRLNEINTQT